MKFVARIGSHPQHLISDKACEINTKVRFIAAGKRLSTHLSSKSKHHSLGVPEKVIGDLDRNTRAVMADVNIPPMCWDIVVQHVALLNACTSPAVCDPSITIFEADKGVVPDLAVFPPPGCFCLRYRASRSQIGCANEPEVFLGFGHLENTFGAVILVKQSLVVARHNVFFLLKACFPSKKRNPASHTGNLFTSSLEGKML